MQASSTSSSTAQASYSDKLKVNVVKSERLKRKVLEIHLVPEDRVSPYIDVEIVAKLFAKLGIDRKTQMYGYQHSGSKIYVWLKEHCDMDKFLLSRQHQSC